MDICNATRNEIVGYLQRIRERAGNLYRGYVVAKHVINNIDVVPTLTNDSRCPFCGNYKFNLPHHIEIKHRKELQKYIDIVINAIRDKVNNGKKIRNT
jgi:hypothetical protein